MSRGARTARNMELGRVVQCGEAEEIRTRVKEVKEVALTRRTLSLAVLLCWIQEASRLPCRLTARCSCSRSAASRLWAWL